MRIGRKSKIAFAGLVAAGMLLQTPAFTVHAADHAQAVDRIFITGSCKAEGYSLRFVRSGINWAPR